ncbi:ABC transporter substrate-binding protein [Mycetocola spongiae]|uniref:ABC transporter substrate-binding protein n=1 Tax=Mycetocola spongiae TaxID=2859226 RepID=UPI001CF51ABF|nr:ABC transporter substrate-binding protein [Mycetocola spongiae]UCR89145.1 ABC transporter substrate-binding protein [Mycetocola spongiae]
MSSSARRSKFLLGLAATTASALVLVGCAGTSSPKASDAAGEIINIGSVYEPTSLDPAKGGSSGITEAFLGNVYEGLVRITDDAKIEPLLAEDWTTSEDGLTYTFNLREATFHSGEPVTADDVVFSLNRVLSPEFLGARKKQLSVISDVKAVDEKTVEVTLNKKSSSFVYNLGYVWIINDSATDLTSTEDGSGPYTLADYRKGSSIALAPYQDYWGEKPKNGGVEFNYFTDPTALNNALLTGQVDVITSLTSPDALPQFENKNDYQIIEGTSTTKELLAFNDRVEPFNNVDVRKAIYSAIDRKKLLESIWDGRGELIGAMIPPSEPGYLDLKDNNPYDVELAKSLLAEAGQSAGFSFTLDTPDSGVHPLVAEFIKGELAKVNITVNISLITDDKWAEKVYMNHDFEATMQDHVNDRDVYFYQNPDFYWGYDNADVQTWLDQAEAAATPEEQSDLIAKANKQISDDAASIWLYLNPQLRVAASDITGVPVNGMNSLFYVSGIARG